MIPLVWLIENAEERIYLLLMSSLNSSEQTFFLPLLSLQLRRNDAQVSSGQGHGSLCCSMSK